MTIGAAKKYLAQFEAIPYAVEIEKEIRESSAVNSLRLNIVLQSRGWTKEDACRIQIDSVRLASNIPFPSEDALGGSPFTENATQEIELRVNQIEKKMQYDVDRQVAIYQFFCSLPVLSENISSEQRDAFLAELFANITLSVTYSTADSEAKHTEVFRSSFSSGFVSWRKISQV